MYSQLLSGSNDLGSSCRQLWHLKMSANLMKVCMRSYFPNGCQILIEPHGTLSF